MISFKIRTTGSDLHRLPEYNSYANGTMNPYHDEFAPLSVRGTMSGLKNKYALGNCTWYAFGRMLEVFKIRPDYPCCRWNAKRWGDGDGAVLSDKPEVGGIVVFGVPGDPDDYGHVAFIEKIENGRTYLSESAYSERTNGFLFKYGRSIQDVEHQWGMKVIRYLAPLKPATSYEAPVPSKSVKGKYINLLPLKDYPRYGTYDMGVVPIAQNISHYIEVMELEPNTGISYEIVDWINPQVACIETRDFGKQQIFVDSTRATVTDKPVGRVYGKKSSKVTDYTGQTLVIHDYAGYVPLYNEDFTYQYPDGLSPRNREFKILRQIADGHYIVNIPYADPQIVGIKWQSGIGFKG
ncbi:CHAP domain-containing protein [Erysipelothrix rhusiopathiae]|uniref:CHAP domain-containing protein n=1 Tax=Erysipelothrix rhusiopathiae TaxID=1648 RepID=UPI0039E95402